MDSGRAGTRTREGVRHAGKISANALGAPSTSRSPGQLYQQPPSGEASSYMWLAICSTILCCLPFGIVSIVYASKVDSYWAAGDYDMAEVNSNKAKTWGIAAAVTGGVLALVYMIIVFTATSSAVLSL